jgi:predicted anti-sigma-YlaC factor YlaD
MIEPTDPNDERLAYWHTRRRRRFLFMLGRYALSMVVIVAVAWATGGLWLRGFALIASVLLALRLAFFFYNGRHLEERLARGRGRSARP